MIDFDGVFDSERCAFDMYFASIVSFQHHPGAGTKEHKALAIRDCADIAIEMLKVRRSVLLDNEV